MALFHGVINSKALMKDTTLSMIVPSDDRKNIGFQGQPQLLIFHDNRLVAIHDYLVCDPAPIITAVHCHSPFCALRNANLHPHSAIPLTSL